VLIVPEIVPVTRAIEADTSSRCSGSHRSRMRRFFQERTMRRSASAIVGCTAGSSSALGDVRDARSLRRRNTAADHGIDVQRFFEPQAASRYRRAPHGQLRVPQRLHVGGAALPPRG
jgi:hypothetical protein